MWVDGVYVKAGLEREKAAILVVMAALSAHDIIPAGPLALEDIDEIYRFWTQVRWWSRGDNTQNL